MSFCPCGKEADNGPLCERCAVLQVLELTPTASPADIRLAYHMMVKVWHPDRFQADDRLKQAANHKLKAINSAYVYLTSNAAASNGRRRRPAAPAQEPSRPPGRPPGRTSDHAARATRASAPATHARRGMFSLRNWLAVFGAFSMLQRLAFLLVGLGGGTVLLKIVDSTLSTDFATAHTYLEYRSQIVKEVEAPKDLLWDTLGGLMRRFRHQPDLPASVAVRSVATDPPPQPGISHVSAHAVPSRKRLDLTKLASFITTGLTKDEVIAIAGTPTSVTADKLVFSDSEIYFKDGSVTGWKLDAASPLHVKLWPASNVDRTLTVFSVDSTKDDVLVVQGTPRLLARDKFGYGSSEIYFHNNRVVGWKNDPVSVPLRAVSR